jgi:alpha-L-arabinofuranosidase
MALNKHRDQPIEVEVFLDGFEPASAEHRVVTGPSVGANNEPETGAPQVELTVVPLAGVSSRMLVTLPARSANALIFRR